MVSETQKLTASQKWNDEINWVLLAGTNSRKLKGDWRFMGWVWSKMGVASLIIGLWKMVSEEWADGINRFFACWSRLTKIKSWSKLFSGGHVLFKNRCGQSCHGNLKLTVLQKWTDGVNLIFCMLVQIQAS